MDSTYSVLDTSQKEATPAHVQSKAKRDKINQLRLLFDRDKSSRDKDNEYFRNRNLSTYISDSQARFNSNMSKPDWKDDWQNNVFSPITHDKAIAILARLASNRMKVEFFPRNKLSVVGKTISLVIGDIYDYIEDVETNGQRDLFYEMLAAVRDGTVVGFEGFKRVKRVEKEIIKVYDDETVEYKEVEFWEETVDNQIVPLLDYYPGKVFESNMNKINHHWWRTVMSYEDFCNSSFKSFKDSVHVKNSSTIIGTINDNIYKVSDDIAEDQVEIIRYFNRAEDEYHIIANGVLLTDVISPLRRKDKRCGFWSAVFEPFDDKFFYGRSLADKLMNMQDVDNTLWNAMLDQLMLSIFKPILTTGVNDLTEDYLYPGRMIEVTSTDQMKEMSISAPDMVAFRMLNKIEESTNFSSIDPTTQGVSVGIRTATEVERAQEGAREILSLFQQFMEWGIKEKAVLRVGTILQYYFEPVGLDRVTTETGAEEAKLKFREFIIKDARIGNESGTRVIRIKADKKDLTPKNIFGVSGQLMAENALIPGKSEIIEVTSEYIKNFQVDVRIVPNSSTKMSESLQKAMMRSFATLALQMPDLYDRKVIGEKLAETFDQNPSEVMAKDQPKRQMAPGGMPMDDKLSSQMQPTAQAAVPDLKSLVNAPI